MWFKSECDKISDRLWDYTAQRLSVSETAQVENHLQQCAKCQAEAEAYRQTVGMLGAARSMPVPASQTTWRDLRPSLTPLQRPATRSTDWLPRLTLAGAGTVMAATLLVAFLSNSHRPSARIDPSANQNGVHRNMPSAAPEETPSPGDMAQNDTHDSTPVVTSGPTVPSFLAGAFSQLPAPHYSAKPPVVTVSQASLERLTRTRRHPYTHASPLQPSISHTKTSAASEEATAQSDGGNATPRAVQHYVLKQVSPADDEATHRYVISSIPTAQGAVASNDGADEGRAW